MARMRRRHARWGIGGAAAVVAWALTLVAPAPAGAGGADQLYPDHDRYDPGEQVRLVGYTQALARSTIDERVLSGVELRRNGPYYAYLRVNPAAAERDAAREGGPWPYVHRTDRRVGRVTADEFTPATGDYSLRVSAAFRLPRDLAPGVYGVTVCNDPCTTTLGWLYDSQLHVGVDPADPIVRAWPLDEPTIRYLDDGALVSDPVCHGACDAIDDWTVTAAEVRAGYRPTAITAPPDEEPEVGDPTTGPPASEPVADAGKSPAGRAGADPAGGASSEVVAWLLGFGVLVVVWCLAWRWRPQEARMVVRQGNGQQDHPSSDDDPRPVQIKL
jgi:hypothetical protein